MKILLPLHALYNANVIQPTKDVRYYLNQVVIEPIQDQGITHDQDSMEATHHMVSTDGHRMYWARYIIDKNSDMINEIVQMHDIDLNATHGKIGIATANKIKVPNSKMNSYCILDTTANTISILDTTGGQVMDIMPCTITLEEGNNDWHYPDWRRVIPSLRGTSQDPNGVLEIGYNTLYLADIAKIRPQAKSNACKFKFFTANNSSEITILHGEGTPFESTYILMPVRI